MTSELETAMTDAQRAGEGGPIEGFVARVADRIGAHATVKAVFGDPIERDGITVIPVAKVRWGFGGGAGGPIVGGQAGEGAESGAATEAAAVATGSGGGGAVTADPVGWLEIGPDGAEFKSIVPAMPSPGFMLATGATAALVLRGIARLFRR
jgi:uncharacterized spore protein YtfJ